MLWGRRGTGGDSQKEQELTAADSSIHGDHPRAPLAVPIPWKELEQPLPAAPGKSSSIFGILPCNYLSLSCPPQPGPRSPKTTRGAGKKPKKTQKNGSQEKEKKTSPGNGGFQRLLRLFLREGSAPELPEPAWPLPGSWNGIPAFGIPNPTPCPGLPWKISLRVPQDPSLDASRDGASMFPVLPVWAELGGELGAGSPP